MREYLHHPRTYNCKFFPVCPVIQKMHAIPDSQEPKQGDSKFRISLSQIVTTRLAGVQGKVVSQKKKTKLACRLSSVIHTYTNKGFSGEAQWVTA